MSLSSFCTLAYQTEPFRSVVVPPCLGLLLWMRCFRKEVLLALLFLHRFNDIATNISHSVWYSLYVDKIYCISEEKLWCIQHLTSTCSLQKHNMVWLSWLLISVVKTKRRVFSLATTLQLAYSVCTTGWISGLENGQLSYISPPYSWYQSPLSPFPGPAFPHFHILSCR